MKALSDLLARGLSLPETVAWLLVAGVLTFIIYAPVSACIAGILTWCERRLAGAMQSRYGPNRVGPQGFLQWVADAVKLLHKEGIFPAAVDVPLFRVAPYLVYLGMFTTFVVIPFGPALIAADLNIGVFYVLGITSLTVVGVLMAGWSSNNKWSMLGGFRSAAQIVSYEIPTALSVGAVVLLTGTFSTQEIVRLQGGGLGLLNWNIFHDPFLFLAAFVFFVSSLAEINRVPFDLPEAESELVSGYNTEYSGMRFAMFFLSEYANVFVLAALATTIFLGGWMLPVRIASPVWANVLGLLIFMAKAGILSLVVLWFRWSLPRLRVDQLMTLCWKYLTPIAFVNLFGVAAWMLLFKEKGIYQLIRALAGPH
jgi:NADH-quinone oxidoreductase subunit H